MTRCIETQRSEPTETSRRMKVTKLHGQSDCDTETTKQKTLTLVLLIGCNKIKPSIQIIIKSRPMDGHEIQESIDNVDKIPWERLGGTSEDEISNMEDTTAMGPDGLIVCFYNWLKSWVISNESDLSDRGNYMFMHFQNMIQHRMRKENKVVNENLLRSMFKYNKLSSLSTSRLIRLAKSLAILLSKGVEEDPLITRQTERKSVDYINLACRLIEQEFEETNPSIDQIAMVANELSLNHQRLTFYEYCDLPKSERVGILSCVSENQERLSKLSEKLELD